MRNAARSRRPQITPARKRLFMLVTILVPVMLTVALELGLRAAGYGTDLSLFTTEVIAGRTYTVMNPDVKGRYFNRVEFSPNTSMDYFLRPKPAGVFRIFCLGGSTTVGFPYGYVGSFSTLLRDRLRKLFPEKTIEVINLGMTATNSYTTADIAREVVGCEPDLIIVYDGHNEFYGALGVASAEGSGGVRWLAKLHLRLVRLRAYQWIRSVVGTFYRRGPDTASGAGQTGTMMERLAGGKTVPYGSDLYRRALENFGANLAELKEVAAEHSVPLLLGSQVSNLRDLFPFVSDAASPSATSVTQAWKLLGDQRADSASAVLRAAPADSARADYHFALARADEELHRPAAALAEYIRARDLDQLRFRTSSDFNGAIRKACGDGTASFVDIEGAFMAASADSLVGSSLILEHLHPNERGYFLMAKAYAAAMARQNLIAPGAEWSRRDTVPDDELWNNRPATELDELCARRRIDLLTSSWPFRSRAVAPPDAGNSIAQIAEKLIHGESTWEEAHVAAAQTYTAQGDPGRAAKEYRALISQLPQNVSAYLLLGQLYLREQNRDEAAAVLEQSLRCEPTVFALRALASISLSRNAFDTAAAWLGQAYELSRGPNERVAVGYDLGKTLWKGGRTAEAERQLAAVLQINPQYRPARALLDAIRAAAPK